jgi:hypothetical protein
MNGIHYDILHCIAHLFLEVTRIVAVRFHKKVPLHSDFCGLFVIGTVGAVHNR